MNVLYLISLKLATYNQNNYASNIFSTVSAKAAQQIKVIKNKKNVALPISKPSY